MSKQSGQFIEDIRERKKMHKNRIIRKENLILIIMALLLINISYSFTTSSGNYSSNITIISSGGTTINSSNYVTLTAIAQPAIGMTGCSRYYKNFVGFMYTLNFSYVDDAPETNATQTSVADYDSDGNIELNWTDESEECFETYRIYRYSEEINKTNIQNAELIIAGIEEGTQFFEDNRTLSGTTYWYALVTVDQAGNFNTSFVSNSLNATANDTIIPRQVTNLNVTGSGNNATLTWKHVERDTNDNSDFFAMKYKIYRGTSVNLSKTDVNDSRSGFSYLKTVSENRTTDTVTASGIYHYIVTAIDDAYIENTTIILDENYGNVSLIYTPPAPPEAPGVAGGEGIKQVYAFSVSRTIIKATLKQGESTTKSFIISNTGILAIELTLEIEGTELALLSDNKVLLKRGESKTISVYMFASETQRPDIYTGKIIIKSEIIKSKFIEKKIGLVIEVLAKKALFDIKVKIPEEYKEILRNKNVRANISLYNLGDLKPVDVNLYYSIKNLEGENLTFKIETLAINNTLSIMRELKVPQNASYDDHLFYVKINYGTETAYGADIFRIVEAKPPSCFDGIRNQGEEGIDCGGSCALCEPLPSPLKKRIFIILIVLIILIITIIIYRKIRRIIIIEKRKKDLEDYIERCIKRGINKELIKRMLLKAGWKLYYIDEAFKKIIIKESIKRIKKGERDILVLYNKLVREGYSKRNLNEAFDILLQRKRLCYISELINKELTRTIMKEIMEMTEKKGERDILVLYNKLAKKGYSKRNLNEAFDILLGK